MEINLIPRKIVVKKEVKQVNEVEEVKIQEVKKSIQSVDQIINKIKELDEGSGVDVDLILDKYENAEKIVKNLLEEGEIFEVRPGRVKVLE